ncbi:U3 small nucleolar RNA-associated protein 4 [Theileria parva strain Muguga]|uniref:Uncharacterized protein n=1 Tax=Theileria parva TaxID=5875 RepID=Q4N5F3_THEPA|nr:U3 small nucleolar RNA-associated protein 4 [Theileria parva strain Muguga]EAN32620.1 U3 small nucleolar RNA-associated protein 4 [Theileria parva strain Muguga]|eukprot:XP_764903.1 hypothetical protein [Theileria parva strain Muguga]
MNNKLIFLNIVYLDDICIHSSSFSNCGRYLAFSYANNVSIYEVSSNSNLKTLSDLDSDASFRSIIWIPYKNLEYYSLSDYRLFTVGLHGIINEWDLNLLRPKRSCTSYGGAIFSGVLSHNSDILIACDDGSVRSFSIWDNIESNEKHEELNFRKVHLRHNKRILSLCSVEDGRVFCGTSDSMILICDLEKENYSKVIKISSTRSRKRVKNENEKSENQGVLEENNVHVWCLLYISSENTLVSGDSNGNVMFWDITTLTMSYLFTQHNNDVLSLCLINDDTLFSAGLDSKVTLYTNNKSTNNIPLNDELNGNNIKELDTNSTKGTTAGWSVSGFKYPIRGDIRTLCVNHVHGLVGSAGNSGSISLLRAFKFFDNKKSIYKQIYPSVSKFIPVVSMNSTKTLALCRYRHHCDLWYVPVSNMASSRDSDTTSVSDRSSDIDLFNDNFYSNVPYKLCQMKMNKNKGRINSCFLSPQGDVVAILNQVGIQILLLNLKELSVSQVKFEYQDLIVSSMAFISNYELMINHFSEGKYLFSIYNVKDGSLSTVKYLDFNKHVIKISVHYNQTFVDFPNNSQFKGGKVWCVFYCLDGNVYVSDHENSNYFTLPRFDSNSRICSVSFNVNCEFLVAFSTSFKYYVYDTAALVIVKYQGKLIHTIQRHIYNPNAVILNSFCISNLVIVQTTHNIFYFKLNEDPFALDSEVRTPLSNKQFDPTNNQHRDISIRDKHNRDKYGNKKGNIVIGPRRLYNIPSIENTIYEPKRVVKPSKIYKHGVKVKGKRENKPEIVKFTDDSSSKYTIIVKNEFIVHTDILMKDSKVNIISFKATIKDDFVRKKKYGN